MLQVQIANQVFMPGPAAGSAVPPIVENCILLESDGSELKLESMDECVLLES